MAMDTAADKVADKVAWARGLLAQYNVNVAWQPAGAGC